MEKNNLKIVFLGTSNFATFYLKALVENNLKPFLVITQPDEPSGRKKILQPSPVKVEAQSLGLELVQPKSNKELKNLFEEIDVDLCVLVAYGRIIPQIVIDQPKFGIINVHPSLLPAYRGPSPIQSAILNGESKTGVTIMLLDDQVDHGPILDQMTVGILSNDTNVTLHESIALQSEDFLIKTLQDYIDGKIKPRQQDHESATFTKIIERADGQVDWSKSDREIYDQFRAFLPWPGIFTYWQDKRLKITNLSLSEAKYQGDKSVGEVFTDAFGKLLVVCGRGVVCLEKVQLEGKKEMDGCDFTRGYKEVVGSILK